MTQIDSQLNSEQPKTDPSAELNLAEQLDPSPPTLENQQTGVVPPETPLENSAEPVGIELTKHNKAWAWAAGGLLSVGAILGGGLIARNSSEPHRVPVAEVPIENQQPNLDQKNNFLGSIKAYGELPIVQVSSTNPEAYIADFNKLYAVAVLDDSQGRSDSAVQALVGGESATVTASLSVDLAAFRQRNLTDPDNLGGGIKFTAYSQPGEITVVESEASYAIVKTANTQVAVYPESTLKPPQITNHPSEEVYYYVNIAPDGKKSLHSIESSLHDWQGDLLAGGN